MELEIDVSMGSIMIEIEHVLNFVNFEHTMFHSHRPRHVVDKMFMLVNFVRVRSRVFRLHQNFVIHWIVDRDPWTHCPLSLRFIKTPASIFYVNPTLHKLLHNVFRTSSWSSCDHQRHDLWSINFVRVRSRVFRLHQNFVTHRVVDLIDSWTPPTSSCMYHIVTKLLRTIQQSIRILLSH